MNVYMIQFDASNRVVEAPSFADAINAWRAAMQEEWGVEYDGTEEPDSVSLVDDLPVIRAKTNGEVGWPTVDEDVEAVREFFRRASEQLGGVGEARAALARLAARVRK